MRTPNRRLVFFFLVPAGLIGLLVACAILNIAFYENPQGEYFDRENSIIRYHRVVPLFLLNFLAAAIVALVFEVIVYGIFRATKWMFSRIR